MKVRVRRIFSASFIQEYMHEAFNWIEPLVLLEVGSLQDPDICGTEIS